jgi:D-amino-acid dehydrogenase
VTRGTSTCRCAKIVIRSVDQQCHGFDAGGKLTASDTDVLVVGGGVVGLCCAYYAQRAGRAVSVVDAGEIGQSASWGNAGLVPVSSTMPLAAPGVIGKALRWLLDPDGAFRISPRTSRGLVSWMLEFRRQCRPERVERVNRLLLALMRESLRLYDELLAEENLEIEYTRLGTLALCASAAELGELLKTNQILRTAGIDCAAVSTEEVLTMEPLVRHSIVGGAYYPGDAHLNPGKLLRALEELVRANGGLITRGETVEHLILDGSRVVGVRTANRVIRTTDVLIASGVGSTKLVRPLGVRLLIAPAKGYHLEFDGTTPPSRPLRLFGAKSVVSGVGGMLRVTSKLELTNAPGIPQRRIIDGIPRLTDRYLHLAPSARQCRSWYGFRPLTPDGLPYIGSVNETEGLLLATGHGQLGVALAPITGALVADVLAASKPRVPLEPYSPNRSQYTPP